MPPTGGRRCASGPSRPMPPCAGIRGRSDSWSRGRSPVRRTSGTTTPMVGILFAAGFYGRDATHATTCSTATSTASRSRRRRCRSAHQEEMAEFGDRCSAAVADAYPNLRGRRRELVESRFDYADEFEAGLDPDLRRSSGDRPAGPPDWLLDCTGWPEIARRRQRANVRDIRAEARPRCRGSTPHLPGPDAIRGFGEVHGRRAPHGSCRLPTLSPRSGWRTVVSRSSRLRSPGSAWRRVRWTGRPCRSRSGSPASGGSSAASRPAAGQSSGSQRTRPSSFAAGPPRRPPMSSTASLRSGPSASGASSGSATGPPDDHVGGCSRSTSLG